MPMEGHLAGLACVHLGCRMAQLLISFEPQTATLAASRATAWAVMAGYLAVLGAAVMGVHAVAARRATRRRKAS